MPTQSDGSAIDFRRLFRVHRLFSAAAFGLRPGALLLATFLVLLLSVGGRAWDGLRGPVVEAPGLLAPMPTDAARSVTKGRFFRIMSEFVPRENRPPDLVMESIDPRWLSAALDTTRRSLDPAQDAMQIDRIGRALTEVEALTPRGTFEATTRALGQALGVLTEAVIKCAPGPVVETLGLIVLDLPVALWQRDRGFVIFFGLFAAIVFSVGGGALSRMTAVAFAERSALSPADATSFALSRWTSFAFAVLLPPLFVGGLFLLGGIVGFALRVPVLNMIGGALYGVALFLGFLAALVGMLWIISLPLSTPAGACDGADAVESCQRSWAYVLRRPLLSLGYLATGVVAWAASMFIVKLVAVATVNLTAASGTWLSGAKVLGGAGAMRIFGNDPIAMPFLTGTERVTGGLIEFWIGVISILVVGAGLGLFWSISTAAYLCLRNACDEQPFDDLWDTEEAPGVRSEQG